ncbi:MAG TPA: DUF1330 domain-containing protein [Phenylobacterium sp.]|jgi:uncharacterized protein (DUF1330 family)|nr:DUF1330 domain-containing protein [Phenylobacterium sp.]
MTDSYIDPDRQAWEIFKSLPRHQPIHMLNLIRLREAAAYPQGHPNHGQSITGLQAYREYGRTIAPHLARLGSRQVWAGSPQVMVTGPASEAWDLAFIVEYPGSQAFIDMVRDPDYRENVVPHRSAAVADSRLLRLTPLDPDDKLGH